MASNHRARSWDSLSEDAQLALACQALHRAAETIAAQAECLAGEMEDGNLADRGGAEALRLLVAVVRATDPGTMTVAGHA
jgi:hypothetical protein